MKIPQVAFSESTPRRWWIYFPFFLVLAVAVFLIWAASQVFIFPYDGILRLDSQFRIQEIDSSGPTHDLLNIGDVIVEVDGVPVYEAQPFYLNKKGGDEGILKILRAEPGNPSAVKTVTVPLTQPPIYEILRQLMPLVVALIFWAVGTGVLTFSPWERAAQLFFAFCLTSSVLLAAGSLSLIAPWAQVLYYFSLGIIGPITVHFHLHFPQRTSFKRPGLLLGELYSFAFFLFSPYLLLGLKTIRSSGWNSILDMARMIFLPINLLIVVGLLLYSYRHASSAGVRSKIRIVVLGGVICALPLVILTLLPDALLHQPIISYTFAFPLLGVIPATYGYSIVRHRLVHLDKHVNRGATVILLYSLLGGTYLILYSFVGRWMPEALGKFPLVNTVLALFLATVLIPIQQRVKKFVDRLFYGGWYDYRSAVTGITQNLDQITDLESLGDTICERVARTLRLDHVFGFFRDLDGSYSVISAAPRSKYRNKSSIGLRPLPKNSMIYLVRMGAVDHHSLRKAIKEGLKVTPEEQALLDSDLTTLWFPITAHNQVLGLLVLGPKFGGDVYSSEDMDILRVIASHSSPLIENIHLVTRLKRHAAELEKRVNERTEEVYAAKERVEAILASVGEGVVVTDLDWNVSKANTAFEEQSGYRASEIIDHKIWGFFKIQETDLFDAIITTLRQGMVWSGEINNHRKDGKPYDIQLTISPVRDQNRQVVGYVSSQRDITGQKELDRLKDRLIFDVSHELRTPVTNLNLYLELLERGKPEKRADYMQVLKGETNRLIELIESILDLSRLELWKAKQMELSAVDLGEIVGEVVSAHRPLAESAGLELIYQPGESLPLVRGEQNQLARLVTNLLSNAIRYTPAGRVCLHTFIRDGHVCLQVQDTGIGIDPEDLDNIFDRFYRGKQVSQSKIRGTGLGLAIVKEILEIHGGRIMVESKIHAGSTFTVCLPCDS